MRRLHIVSCFFLLAAVTMWGCDGDNGNGPSPQLDRIDVSPTEVDLYIGQQQQFTAIGYDENGNQMDPPITPVWSTDGGTMDSDGRYTATEEGDFNVIASVSGSTVAGTSAVHVTSQLILSLKPDSIQSSVDQRFEIEIQVENAKDLFGFSCEVEYDDAKIEAVEVVTGIFLGYDVVDLSKIETGTVNFVVTRKRGAGGVTGSGVLGKITFTSLAVGHSDIVFDRSTLAMHMEDGNDVPNFVNIVLEASGVDIE